MNKFISLAFLVFSSSLLATTEFSVDKVITDDVIMIDDKVFEKAIGGCISLWRWSTGDKVIFLENRSPNSCSLSCRVVNLRTGEVCNIAEK